MEQNLFDTNVLMKLYKEGASSISGSTTIFNIIEYPKALEFFQNLEIIYPKDDDFKTAIKLSKDLLVIGTPIPAVDILIASICYNSNFKLISLDSHFSYISDIWEDFRFSKEI